MNGPLLSIVIPLYNVEPYIKCCIASLETSLRASGTPSEDIEIICVDDGSSDGTLRLLRELCVVHAWLKVLHQDNSGASSARNRGLGVAAGKYIAFVDGDDYVELGFFSELMPLLKKDDFDIVCFGTLSVTLSGEKMLIGSLPDESTEVGSSGFFNAILDPRSGYQGFSVGKAVRRDVLLREGALLQFDPGIRILEDEWFWLHVATRCKRVLLDNHALYDYRVRLDSATSTINATACWDDLKMRDRVVDFASTACPEQAVLAWWRRRLKTCSLARRFYLDCDRGSLRRLRPHWIEARKGLSFKDAPISAKQKIQVALCDAAMAMHVPVALLKPFRGFIGKGNERLAAERPDSD